MDAAELPALKTTDLDGPVAYREWPGPGETTFVLVHGLGGSQVNWIRVAPGLAGLGRVLAPDLPGFGHSPRGGRDTGVMSLRRTLSGFISKNGTGSVIVCGNSMGGAIAMLQAAIQPGSVQGLVLTAAAFPKARNRRPHPLVSGLFSMYQTPRVGERLVMARLRRMNPEQIVRMGLRFAAADARSIPEQVIREHIEVARQLQADPEGVTAFLDAARSLMRLGARPDIARRTMDAIECPVLVLHGRRDRLVPAAFAEAALARYPTWRGRIFPDLGHVPMLEAPGRWLAEVADWHAELGL